MRKINFTKINGAGNDFILIDVNLNDKVDLSENLIQQMCDRRKGIGADGILIISENNKADFELKYYNSNGKLGSLCGNGARCSILYAARNYNIEKENISFICKDEYYSGKNIDDEIIKFYLNKADNIELNVLINLESFKLRGSFINTGSPHVVIFWDEIKDKFETDFFHFPIKDIGREIRYAKQFQPQGTNVNFIKNKNGVIYIRTYERGVEEETLACGTGSVAAAIITYLLYRLTPPIILETIGKDKLIVDFEENNDKISKISLTGPAKINYIGTFNY